MQEIEKLNVVFDVVPHGVRAVDGEIYAVFKMIISLKEFNGQYDENTFFKKEAWDKLMTEVNNMNLYTTVKPGPSANEKVFEIGKTPSRAIQFALQSVENEIEYTDRPHFGNEFVKKGRFKNPFKFLEKDEFFFPPKAITGTSSDKPLKQFETTTAIAGQGIIRSDYTDIIRSATSYAMSYQAIAGSEASAEGQYNFRSIYASLLDDPQVAETKYGLVRQFDIHVNEFLSQANDVTYSIVIQLPDHSPTEKDFRITKRMVGGETKYYNGFKKMFFVPGDFAAVNCQYFDPYKGFLENEKAHPDGIYVIGTYKSNGVVLEDPFKNRGVKGFNIIVQDNTKKTRHCLSIHNKEIHFKSGNQIGPVMDPGLLSPLAQIQTKEGSYISNLLFVWRGDSLAVNRVPEKFQEKKDNPDSQEITTDTEKEDDFVRNYLFEKKEGLAPSSQIQLLAGGNYTFYMRTMMSTHHCIKLRQEMSDEEAKYTLTLEDLNEAEKPGIAQDITYNIAAPDKLPIKSLTIIGNRTYRNVNSNYVDNQRHMVLNLISNEHSESRFLYPPQIKFEDFRFLGYLTNNRLKKKKEEKLTRDEFVNRCIRLERRAENKIPAFAFGEKDIDYLADPRGKYLYFYPADLFTYNKVGAHLEETFAFEEQFPFFQHLESCKLILQRRKTSNILMLDTNRDEKKVLYGDLKDGIYNFKVFTSDRAIDLNNLDSFNAAELKVTLLNKPEQPELKPPLSGTKLPDLYIASRIYKYEKDKNYWFHSFSLTKDKDEWKSVKYQEETTVLKLQHENVEKLLKNYYARHKVKKEELLIDEYPYEIFLTTEGRISKKDELRTAVYPAFLQISVKTSAGLRSLNKTFFRLNLNDEEVLLATLHPTRGLILTLGDQVKVSTGAFDLSIVFDEAENQFVIRDGATNWCSMKKYINPDLSIHDVEISEEMLKYVALDKDCQLKLERSAKYSFIHDMGHPYYRKKKVQLFASSIFQAYFPQSKTEFEMGSSGAVLNIEIPNNTLPETPLVDAELMLMHTKTNSWRDSGSKNIKESKTEVIVRVTLQDDFMREGKNKLGIVLSRPGVEPHVAGPNISRMGEDITKFTKNNWSAFNLKDVINFQDPPDVFKKYFEEHPIKNYTINGNVYEVFECQPYYNPSMKKWQILLSFKPLRKSETLFLKLKTIKIAPGHGLAPDPQQAGTYIDNTSTNLSGFSESVELPIYNRKSISLEKTRYKGKAAYKIINNAAIDYKEKVFFVMLLKEKMTDHVFNLNIKNPENRFPSLKEFRCFDLETDVTQEENAAAAAKPENKVLLFRSDEVHISREHCHAILVLEFEKHENTTEHFDKEMDFVSYNPLFDSNARGLRLINMAEFEL